MNVAERIRAHFKMGLFAPPCPEIEIARAEARLKRKIPLQLRELYLAFNGFRGPGNAQYLYPLIECTDGGSSLVDMTLLFRDWELVNLSGFIFFGSNTASENLGINLADPTKIIRYHHNMEAEYEVAGSSLLDVYLADEAEFKEIEAELEKRNA